MEQIILNKTIENKEKTFPVMFVYNDITDIAKDILETLNFTKSVELSEKISIAWQIFAGASGYCILPAPKWETKARGYKPIESRNYIIGFAYEVAHDIDMWLFYKDGADAWLKSIHKEYIAIEARDRMLTAFDSAFKKWQKRKQMSKEDIGKSRRETIDGINKTFRECSNIAHGVFFVDQLENIHR